MKGITACCAIFRRLYDGPWETDDARAVSNR